MKTKKFNEFINEKKNMKKVFLGGTVNGSNWREKLIKKLKIEYFDPVVDWNEKAQKREIREREKCDYCLYVITPKMKGTYSIAEAVDDSNKRPEKTLFLVLNKDKTEEEKEYKTFNEFQIKSLVQVSKMIEENGGKSFKSLNELAEYLNE